MRYSEAKKIIQTLHAAGWRKYYDLGYVKKWEWEGFNFSRRIDFFELPKLNFQLVMLLDEFDDDAEHQFRKIYEDRLKDS